MAATQISEMRPTHEGILDHVLARPHATLRELAAVTGYSVSWLSQVMRSDCFKAAYDARRGDLNCEIMMSITDRLQALSHLAIDKIEAQLTNTENPDFILDSFDKIMHRTGYAPNSLKTVQGTGPALQQNNVFLVDKEFLGTMREKIVNGTPEAIAGEVIGITDASQAE
jgi:hypothetical protein